jgi:DnaJ family protein C protein 9
MDKILEVVECSTGYDSERFEKIIREAIKDKTVSLFKLFDTTTTLKAHQKRIEKERKAEEEFEKVQKEDNKKKENKKKKKEDSTPSLMEMIQSRAIERHAKMNSIIESLEAEAAQKTSKGKKRKQAEEMPSEEDFLKLQEKMLKKSKK